MYVEPAPNASNKINYPHMYEELMAFVLNLVLISNNKSMSCFPIRIIAYRKSL